MTAMLRQLTGMFLATAILLLGSTSARADRLPLTAPEQAAVNKAITQGVIFLRATQGPSGSWATKNDHTVGYTALPALTLLECGVPANDAGIQAAAKYVRNNAAKLDGTYEVALAILLLDKLGEARDKPLIQTLAVRLIVGQTPSGGWGYKVPIMTPTQQLEFLTLLRRAYPLQPMSPLVIAETPNITGSPDPLARKDLPEGGPLMALLRPTGALVGPTGQLLLMRKIQESPGLASSQPASTNDAGSRVARKPEESPGFSLNNDAPASSSWTGDARGRVCLRMLDAPPPEAAVDIEPGNVKPVAKQVEWVIPAMKPIVVPKQFQGLMVFQDARMWMQGNIVDLPKRDHEAMGATTDNSNTQFAILALWAAQRYDVPMERTLGLLAHRYTTSQNLDGNWDYPYHFGGSNDHRPAMTAVGLLGLAVGYGINNRDANVKAQRLQDPRLVNGFVALNKHVGTPTGQMQNQPMFNLYNLWSIERVAVLYNLGTFGEKDWYRWGAEILVSNQQPPGNWMNGAYHGSTPVIDTCFALLFLKRANLAQDLTGRLPFNPDNLTSTITESVKKDEGKKDKPVEAPLVAATPVVPPVTPPTLVEGNTALVSKNGDAALVRSAAALEAASSDDSGNSNRKWIILGVLGGLVLLVLIACPILYLVFRNFSTGDASEDEDEGEGEERSPRKKKLPSKKARA